LLGSKKLDTRKMLENGDESILSNAPKKMADHQFYGRTQTSILRAHC